MTDPVLIDNLFSPFRNELFDMSSTETKEMMLKDSILKIVREIQEKLNLHYKDVKFSFEFCKGNPAIGMTRDGNYRVEGFNKHTCSDMDYEEENETEQRSEILYECPLEELGLKVTYTHEQHCDLGHTHYTSRFYYYSLPKLMEIVTFYMLNPKWIDDFVVNYAPNFFY